MKPLLLFAAMIAMGKYGVHLIASRGDLETYVGSVLLVLCGVIYSHFTDRWYFRRSK